MDYGLAIEVLLQQARRENRVSAETHHRMAAALKEKGYRYQYIFALDSGHRDRNVREQTLPETLEWVWRDYEVTRR
jgi:hypothetical protein